MARLADIVATARATVGHIIRYISGGGTYEMPNRQYLDFAGNCTVNDDGNGIRVTIPEVPAGSVTVGNVITLQSGEMAYVRNMGTPIHAILDFGIPRGDPSTDIQPIFLGGTGADTEEGARENLSVPSIADLEEVSGTVTTLSNNLDTLSGTVTALDTSVVHLTGNESIAGNKTFTGNVIIVTQALSDDSTKAANTEWVRDYIDQKLADTYFYDRGTTGS